MAKNSSNEQDQALSQYRQQQQQQRSRQEASASTNNTGQPTEEELVARGDVVRSNLFSHTLSEDDHLKNLTSILIASSSNGTTNGEDERETTTSSGNGAGLFETLRSAISTHRSSVSANKVECSICLMEYAAGETVSWAKEEGCDHAYHQQCIVGWLSTAKRDGTLHDSCPLCRTKLITETNAAEA